MIWIYDRVQEHTTTGTRAHHKIVFTKKKKNHEYMIQIICARITYIIGHTQVYDSVMADVMKKIAT